jgi:hypothetical protein
MPRGCGSATTSSAPWSEPASVLDRGEGRRRPPPTQHRLGAGTSRGSALPQLPWPPLLRRRRRRRRRRAPSTGGSSSTRSKTTKRPPTGFAGSSFAAVVRGASRVRRSSRPTRAAELLDLAFREEGGRSCQCHVVRSSGKEDPSYVWIRKGARFNRRDAVGAIQVQVVVNYSTLYTLIALRVARASDSNVRVSDEGRTPLDSGLYSPWKCDKQHRNSPRGRVGDSWMIVRLDSNRRRE